MLRILAATLFSVAAFAASAQTPATLRGTLAAVSGDALTVKTRAGESVAVRLSLKSRIVAVVAATAADLKPNSFIGVAAVPDGDGLKALEVHIFPEAMRGTGEGYRAFDLAPGSSMTNGALSLRVGGVEGDRLTVDYKGGAKTIRLPKDTPIVALTSGARDDLKPGAAVIVRGAKADDGGVDAGAVLVGRNGVVPPM